MSVSINHGLTAEHLRTLYWLDEHGVLRHKPRPLSMFSHCKNPLQVCNACNTKYANKEVNFSADAYKQTWVLCPDGIKRQIKVHNIKWTMEYGYWPLEIVDHANGDTLDNSPHNLRLATDSQSSINRGLRSDNTTGVTGVYRHRDKWRVMLMKQGKIVFDKMFNTRTVAIKAREAAELKYFGKYRRKKKGK